MIAKNHLIPILDIKFNIKNSCSNCSLFAVLEKKMNVVLVFNKEGCCKNTKECNICFMS